MTEFTTLSSSRSAFRAPPLTEPFEPRQKLAIKHTTRTGRVLVKDVQYRLDVNTLHRDQDTKELGLNEIGRVQLRTAIPLLCDPYTKTGPRDRSS